MGSINSPTRAARTFKVGALREHERFTQARSRGLRRRVQRLQRQRRSRPTPGSRSRISISGHVTSYTESMGRRPDNAGRPTGHGSFRTPGSPPKLRWISALRMCNEHLTSTTGEASIVLVRSLRPHLGGKPPVLSPTVSRSRAAARSIRVTGQISPATFIGQMVPGTGYTCGVIVPERPCQINGVVVQNNGDYVSGGVGFVESPGLLYDPRFERSRMRSTARRYRSRRPGRVPLMANGRPVVCAAVPPSSSTAWSTTPT